MYILYIFWRWDQLLYITIAYWFFSYSEIESYWKKFPEETGWIFTGSGDAKVFASLSRRSHQGSSIAIFADNFTHFMFSQALLYSFTSKLWSEDSSAFTPIIKGLVIGVKVELSYDQSFLVKLISNGWLNIKSTKLSANIAIEDPWRFLRESALLFGYSQSTIIRTLFIWNHIYLNRAFTSQIQGLIP